MLPTARLNPTQPTQIAAGPLTANAALPGHVVVQDKRSVAITSNALTDFLGALYEASMRNVVAVVETAGQRLVIEAVIYRKFDKRSGRVRYLLYPLQPAQSLLRDMLSKWRDGALPDAKRPMPIMIHGVMPKLK